jgi:hypothetical protein
MEENAWFASVPVKPGAPKKHKHNRWVWSPWQEEYGALFIFSLVHPVNIFCVLWLRLRTYVQPPYLEQINRTRSKKKNERRQSLRTALRRDCRCWFFFCLLGTICSKCGGCTYVLRRNPSFESTSSERGRKKKRTTVTAETGAAGIVVFFFSTSFW